jgi:hypothetical protein
MTMSNTLAYYNTDLITHVKSFIVLAPGFLWTPFNLEFDGMEGKNVTFKW